MKVYTEADKKYIMSKVKDIRFDAIPDLQVFYIDYGISKGMQYGMDYAKEHNIPFETRTIL